MKKISKQAKNESIDLRMDTEMILLLQSVQEVPALFTFAQFKEYWPQFVKSCLKYGLRPANPSLPLKALKELLKNVLQADYTNEAADMYSLICGHSQFVPILFSKSDEEKKEAMLNLILLLIQSKPSICSSVQVPVYLGAYNATMTKTDQLLFQILFLHETEGTTV